MVNEIACIVFVAFTWGATSPLIKYGITRIRKITEGNVFVQFYLEVKYFLTSMNTILPIAMYLIGSVLYFFLLQKVKLIIAVPLTNSLTFVVTAITAWILRVKTPGRNTLFGIFLVFLGSYLSIVDTFKIK